MSPWSNSKKRPKSTNERRLRFLINERFQWRYTSYLVITIVVATLLTGGVTAYFLNQNYSIFERLAYLHAPDLLPQLEREQIWINTFLFAFFVALVSFNFIFGLKMTSRIAGPIMVLKRHIRNLNRGLFTQDLLRIRDTDEFRDLVETYNYLHLSLRAQIQRDIHHIEQALREQNAVAARSHLHQLLTEKKSQLSMTSDHEHSKTAEKGIHSA